VSGPWEGSHEGLIRELLDELDGGEREAIDSPGLLDGEARQRLLRLDLELLASLPFTLDPIEPSPGLKRDLLTAVGVVSIARPAARQSVRRGRLLPLAAALTAVSLGLAGLLFDRLRDQEQIVADLRTRVEQLRAEAGQTAAMRTDMQEARRQLALVGTPGVEVCPLKPRTPATGGEAPWGVLYVAPDHQHWYLAVRGLQPTPEGHAYQLWFVAHGRPVSAGTFSVEPGGPVELSSETMPEGTSAVLITLEPIGGVAEPQGPEVLFGDGADAMRVL
jgi:anti-sigma-K factor RskA